jgi:hypothetical protein
MMNPTTTTTTTTEQNNELPNNNNTTTTTNHQPPPSSSSPRTTSSPRTSEDNISKSNNNNNKPTTTTSPSPTTTKHFLDSIIARARASHPDNTDANSRFPIEVGVTLLKTLGQNSSTPAPPAITTTTTSNPTVTKNDITLLTTTPITSTSPNTTNTNTTDNAVTTTTTTSKNLPSSTTTTYPNTQPPQPLNKMLSTINNTTTTTNIDDVDVSDDEAEVLVEFGRDDANLFIRMLYAIERDMLNWYGSIISLVQHGWSFEAFLTIVCAVISTTVFCVVPIDGHAFAARLDFTIIGSAVVFPTTFLIAETFRRREGAIQRLASIKALLCQLEMAYLTWRWKGNSDMGEEWELEVHKTINHTMRTIVAILSLPTWNTNRHIYTSSGRQFKAKVVKRERELMHRMGVLFSRLHIFTEDLKSHGLPPNEASRVNQYNCLLQIDFEALVMVKCYRTPNIARSFVRLMVLVCPIFYGPYFAWVSGIIGGGAQTNLAFAIALTVLTVFILLGLVRVQRAMEDPFTSNFPGDVIDMKDELNDTEARLELILGVVREKRGLPPIVLAATIRGKSDNVSGDMSRKISLLPDPPPFVVSSNLKHQQPLLEGINNNNMGIATTTTTSQQTGQTAIEQIGEEDDSSGKKGT